MTVDELERILFHSPKSRRVVVYHDFKNFDISEAWVDKSKTAQDAFGDWVLAIQLREVEE